MKTVGPIVRNIKPNPPHNNAVNAVETPARIAKEI